MRKPDNYASIFLLLVCLSFIISSTWWKEDGSPPYLFIGIHSLLFCISGYLLFKHYLWIAIYLPLGSISIISLMLNDSFLFLLLNEVSSSLIFALLFWAVIRHSWLTPNVPKIHRLLIGISGFLLLGIFWSTQFNILLKNNPNALFSSNAAPETPILSQELLYYSFITITSVGYGDLTPSSSFARTLAILASLSGTLYLAVFISALIGHQEKTSTTSP